MTDLSHISLELWHILDIFGRNIEDFPTQYLYVYLIKKKSMSNTKNGEASQNIDGSSQNIVYRKSIKLAR